MMGSIIDRALSLINDNLKDQTTSFSDPVTVKPMARGGRLLEDEYPSQYMPGVGRQVMADGGMPDDDVANAIQTANMVGDMPPIPAAPPRPAAPGFEGRVAAPRPTLGSMYNVPEGAPWAERSEEEAKLPRVQSLADAFNKAIEEHIAMPYKDRVANTRASIQKLAPYVGMRKDGKLVPLLGKNEKLMKAEAGYKGDKPIEVDGMGVETAGLALSPAFKMGNFQTCPNHASCKDACLGKTSGNYFKVGGGKDLDAFKGPRLNALNKTIAMLQEPEAFAVRLFDEIQSAKREAEYNGNKLGVRLNVLSDLSPKILEPIIKNHPEVSFYDYTKMGYDPVAENHHYTYSSTGVSQEGADNPYSNWNEMRRRLDGGQNVAMAFSHKDAIPQEVHDEETGKVYRVISGDTHDFRPLDSIENPNEGVIVGLKNKNVASKNDTAHKESKGFFVNYDPKFKKTAKGTLERDEDGKPIPTNFRVSIKPQKGKGK